MTIGPRILLFAVLLAAGLGVGWLAGGIGAARSDGARGTASKTALDRLPAGPRKGIPPHARAMMRRVMEAGGWREQTREVVELANRIPIEEIETWLDGTYFDLTDGRVEGVYYQILYARLLEADPERLLRRCLRLKDDQTSEFMKKWAREDPAAAEAFVLSQQSSKGTVMGPLLEVLAARDPLRAIELISRHGTEISDQYSFSTAFENLAKTHRGELLDASASWTPQLRRQARQLVGAHWLEEDFAGAMAWLQQQPDGRRLFSEAGDRNRSIGPVLLEHAASLPEGWLQLAIRESGYNLASGAPLEWLQADAEDLGITAKDLSRVQSYAARNFGGRRENREEALALLANAAALAPEVRSGLVSSIVGSWSQEDPDAAEAWLAGLDDEQLRDAGLKTLESRRNPPRNQASGPAELIGALAQESEGHSYYGNHETRYWTARQTEDALAAFRALGEAERDRAADVILSRRTNLGPIVGAEAVNQALRSEPKDERARLQLIERASGVAASWGELDPAAAAEWVSGLPAGELRQWAARNLVNTWMRLSETEARAWADGLESAEDREFLAPSLEE